jgi:hypothetical protein
MEILSKDNIFIQNREIKPNYFRNKRNDEVGIIPVESNSYNNYTYNLNNSNTLSIFWFVTLNKTISINPENVITTNLEFIGCNLSNMKFIVNATHYEHIYIFIVDMLFNISLIIIILRSYKYYSRWKNKDFNKTNNLRTSI